MIELFELNVDMGFRVDFGKLVEECLADFSELSDGICTHHFATRVHRKLRHAEIDRSHTKTLGTDRANC